MRSIFGRCIAIAMMAAIAIAWHSPPVQATHEIDEINAQIRAAKADRDIVEDAAGSLTRLDGDIGTANGIVGAAVTAVTTALGVVNAACQ